MIRSGYTQAVTIAGLPLLVTGLSVRESDDQPVPQLDFQVFAEVQSTAALDALQIGAAVEVVQESQGRVITWRGQVASVGLRRGSNADLYDVTVEGEAGLLARRRFTDTFEGLTASQVIISAMARHGAYTGLSVSGVQDNPARLGDIVARQDTLLDIIDSVAKRAGWTWRVEAGVLYFQAPESYAAPFALASGVNLSREGYEYTENITEVRNVLRAEAYEYQNVLVEAEVSGCVQAVYGQAFGPEWGFAGLGRITSPEELSDVAVEVDPISGRVEFSRPLILESEVPDPIPDDWDPAEAQAFPLRVEYLVRRKLLLEKRDLASVELYGERHAVYRPGRGGDSVEAVFTMLGTELQRKAFPLITARASVADFGLRPGMTVTVLPFGRSQPVSMRVASIRHTSSGSDLQIEAELASRTYSGVDPVPELFQRVENLEKQDLDPRSVAGAVVREVGALQTLEAPTSALKIADAVQFFIAGLGRVTGGGSIGLESFAFNTQVVSVSGGGSLAFTDGSQVATAVSVTGGGSLSAMRGADAEQLVAIAGGGSLGLTIQGVPLQAITVTGGGSLHAERAPDAEQSVEITGGGSLQLLSVPLSVVAVAITGGGTVVLQAGPALDNARVTEDGSGRVTEDGSGRIVEDEPGA